MANALFGPSGFEVLGRTAEGVRIVAQASQGGVAVIAEDASDLAGGVAVINAGRQFLGEPAEADGAGPTLSGKHGSEVLRLDSVGAAQPVAALSVGVSGVPCLHVAARTTEAGVGSPTVQGLATLEAVRDSSGPDSACPLVSSVLVLAGATPGPGLAELTGGEDIGW